MRCDKSLQDDSLDHRALKAGRTWDKAGMDGGCMQSVSKGLVSLQWLEFAHLKESMK